MTFDIQKLHQHGILPSGHFSPRKISKINLDEHSASKSITILNIDMEPKLPRGWECKLKITTPEGSMTFDAGGLEREIPVKASKIINWFRQDTGFPTKRNIILTPLIGDKELPLLASKVPIELVKPLSPVVGFRGKRMGNYMGIPS